MTSNWIGPVATAVVGLGGIAATTWTSHRGRESTMAAARMAAETTLAIAREERTQRRVEAAYIAFLEYISQLTWWSRDVRTLAASSGGSLRAVPQPDDRPGAEALINAYQSHHVDVLWKGCWDATVDILEEHRTIEAGAKPHPGRLQQLSTVLDAVLDRFVDQIRAELVRVPGASDERANAADS